MAITDINISGTVRDDAGNAVNGITVYLLHTDAALGGAQEATDTTDSDGVWNFTETSLDVNYDVKITSGSQNRYIPWSDEIALKTVDTSVLKVRGASNTAAAPIYLFADLATDAGDGWRIQATDSHTFAIGSDKASAGTIIDYITITNGATAAASNTTILGQLTIGVDGTGADVKFFGATSGKYWLWDESADGVVQIGTLTVGVDGTGHDVKFFGATSGQYLLWDESADELVLAGDTKLSFHDAAGGENIIASANGHLEVNAGTTLDITAPTVDLNSSTEFNIDTAIYDLNASGAVTINATGLMTVTGENDAVGAIYLRANAGTSETVKIHSDQGTSVTEGAESVTILSDAGGVGIRSTANLAKAVNITSDGGTTGSIALFNDQGTSVTEGAESISLLSDAGGVGIRSTANLANAVNITVDGGTTSTMTLFNDQGTAATEGAASIQLLSDVGGINIKSGLNGANAILLTADAGTSETIVVHADQGSGTGSIELLSDAGGIKLTAASDVTIPSGVGLILDGSGDEKIESDGTDISISVGSNGDINIPADVGLTFGNDGEKIEGDGSDLTISGNTIKLNGNTTVAGTLLPTTDDTYDLGSNSAAWQDLFIEGNITMTDAGSITTSAGNLTLGASAGNDVLLGDDVVLLAVDGGTGSLAINPAGATGEAVNWAMVTGNGAFTSGGASSVAAGMDLRWAITAANGDTSWQTQAIIRGSIATQGNSETVADVSTLRLQEPTITVGSGDTVTNAATLLIVGAPTEGTNDYALFVDSGASRFDGAISLGTDHGDDGQQLTSGGDDAACDWTAASSLREHKDIGREADSGQALQAMLDSKAYHFRYKEKKGTGDSRTEYVGLMADDAPWAMHYGNTIVNPVNTLGYTVLAVQALHDKITRLEAMLER